MRKNVKFDRLVVKKKKVKLSTRPNAVTLFRTIELVSKIRIILVVLRDDNTRAKDNDVPTI